jgi:hypothetical protein
MGTNVTIGYGITVGIWNGASYVNVAEVERVVPPQLSRASVEATHHGSPNGYREYIPGLKDGGKPSIMVNYVPANVGPLIAAFEAQTTGQFRITLPDGKTITFNGVVENFTPEFPREEKMVATLTWQVSGQPVWA